MEKKRNVTFKKNKDEELINKLNRKTKRVYMCMFEGQGEEAVGGGSVHHTHVCFIFLSFLSLTINRIHDAGAKAISDCLHTSGLRALEYVLSILPIDQLHITSYVDLS